MNDDTFRATIRAEVEDDGPRLIYADWLEERGDTAHAELIRVQCELARFPPEPRLSELRARQVALLNAHRDTWLDAWHNDSRTVTERGFLEIRLQAPHLPALPTEPRWPSLLLELIVSANLDLAGERHAIRHARHLDRLTGLSIRGGSTEALNVTRSLLANACWPLLTGLELPFCPDDGQSLDGLERLTQLTRLTFRPEYYQEIGADDLRPLLASPVAERLTSLTLAQRRTSVEVAQRISEAPSLSTLHRLNMTGQKIGPEGGLALAESPYLQNLQFLGLSGNRLRDTGVRALATSTALRPVRVLQLSDNEIGGPGVRALLDSPHLDQLEELHLDKNFIGDATAAQIAESPRLAQLRQLQVGQDLSDIGLALLVHSPHVASLEVLEVSGTLGDGALHALMESPYLKQLRILRMSAYVKRTMIDRLLDCSALPRLRRVNIPVLDLDPEAARARWGERYAR